MKRKLGLTLAVILFFIAINSNVLGKSVSVKEISLSVPDSYDDWIYIEHIPIDNVVTSMFGYVTNYNSNSVRLTFSISEDMSALPELNANDFDYCIDRIKEQETGYNRYTVTSKSMVNISGVDGVKIKCKHDSYSYYETEDRYDYISTEYEDYYFLRTDNCFYEFKVSSQNNDSYFSTSQYKDIMNSLVIKDTVNISRNVPFTDVRTDDWYYKSVKFAYSNNIVNGTSSYKFSPNTKLTRGMIVTILYGMEGKPKVTASNRFSDVQSKMYYYNAVLWASQKGIVNGSNGKFRPDDNITRQDLAVILMAYSRYKGKYVASNNTLGGFSDKDSVTSYALPAIKWAVTNRIINGSNGKINPKGTATRAEAVTMIYSYVSKFGR